jgi:HlyD family secretion protein
MNLRRSLSIVVLIAVAAAAGFYFFPDWSGSRADPAYRTAKVDRGEIIATVSASGTINPITTVIVGSQLSGQVVEVLADYNSQVASGQVVARLNSDQIRAKLDAARADLAQMRATRQVQEAQIDRVRADTEKAKAAQADMEAQVLRNEALLTDAERTAQRQTELKAKGFVAESAFDTAQSQRDAQRAALSSARAQLLSAKAQIIGLGADLKVAEANLTAVAAQVMQREATVRQIEVDLRNTEIRSPVQGVVVQRNVELGATVAATMTAPTLFLIADDLHRMEIAANIDETDVGRIKTGQRVTFTVNAYPGRNFEGTVKQVRLGSQTVQNVVIYTTIISVANPRLELMPGMTANLRVETDRRENVVRVPNAALRWRPPSITPEQPASPAALPGAAETGARQGTPGATRGAGRTGGSNVRELVEALKTELTLTSAQQKDIDAALADMRKLFAGGQGGDGDQAARREALRIARQELDDRIANILTAEQRPKLDEIRKRLSESQAGQTGRVFVLGGDGKAQGVTVRIGATDGGTTEILSGLADGGQVIVGGGARTDAAARAPRFGF